MDKLKQKWHSLQPRERLLLGVGGVFIALLLLYYVILSPLIDGVNNMQQQVSLQQNLAAWMQPRVQVLQRSRGGGNLAQTISANELLPTIDMRIKQSAFASSVKDISQTNSNGVRITLESVPFDALMSWLTQQWQQSRITVSDMDVNKSKKVGLVDATMTLVAGTQ